MSQDLFAAFGGPGVEDAGSTWRQEASHRQDIEKADRDLRKTWVTDQPAGGGPHTPQASDSFAEDDDFGDFEDASAPSGQIVESVPETPAVDSNKLSSLRSPATTSKHFPPKAPPKPETVSKSPEPRKEESKIGQHPFAGRMDLLFEADEDDYDAGQDELGDLSTNPEAAVAYSKRIIAAQEAARAKLSEPSRPSLPSSTTTSNSKSVTHQEPAHMKRKSIEASAKDPNVLFDADNLSEDTDDDFDDFETAEDGPSTEDPATTSSVTQGQNSLASMDLLGLDDTAQPTINNNAPESPPSAQKMGSSTDQRLNNRPIISSTPSQLDDDAWDDFETATPPQGQTSPNQNSLSSFVPNSRLDRPKPSSEKDSVPPPTNVPPPAMLLSLFQTLFTDADENLFNIIGKLDMKQKQMLLAHPASHQFLKSHLSHCIVLARIIAGRKLRWKRDQYLTQNMRIGPAAAGGKSGMKLTGVDRTEVAKEDREVLDVLRLWKAQIGKLRTAVTAASSAPGLPKLSSVPEIGEQMPIKTLKAVDGGITAPHACALCGLKREERVSKVDNEVQDNFGEWWVQGTNMHVLCRDFWDEFEKKLKSR